MNVQNLEIVIVYLAVLSLVLFLSIKFRDKFWILFGTVLFPLVAVALILFNLISFPSINQAYINPAYQGRLQRLPSNELSDLFKMSATPLKSEWIYPFVEDYYLGRTLLIPESLLDSLDLELDRLLSQGRLADVKIIELEWKLSEDEVELILGMETVAIPTREVDSNNNITMREGDIYHFVTEEKDPDSPLLLLAHESQLFFIPEDLLTDLEVSL